MAIGPDLPFGAAISRTQILHSNTRNGLQPNLEGVSREQFFVFIQYYAQF